MKTIGIRAAPAAVTFAIYDSDTQAIVNVEKIIVPAAFDTPDALKYIRSNLLDVMREYGVTRAGVRATEPSAQNPSVARIEIEGVIKEAFASSDLDGFYIGHISSIASRLGIDRADLKPIIDGAADPGVENWGAMSKEQREAILCAKGAVNA
ncbi:hypothetical protein [Hoeflea sp. 108]|jgi:hypothetical protein|uniref:hypothetical protein n=1 Tax=Hoeflea sp. 108 TaxID=1116369 RepID=UPI000364EAFC|nr:hypothetical protein [Hoeflea sp. 108]